MQLIRRGRKTVLTFPRTSAKRAINRIDRDDRQRRPSSSHDGPQPEATDAMLDLLERIDVRATFFVVGQHAEAHPELIRRMHAAGHAVHNHGYRHRNHLLRDPRHIVADVRRGSAVIEDIIGVRLTLYRPPQGVVSAVSSRGIVLLHDADWYGGSHHTRTRAAVERVVARLHELGLRCTTLAAP